MREPSEVSILVVDDEGLMRKTIAFDFKKKGFRVLEAASGTEAYQVITSEKIDIVLSDVRMPSGDGIELLDKVKALNPELPVVMFITGFADISIEEAHDRGADAIFAKPFDRKALMSAVLRAIATKEEKWNTRKFEREEVEFKIELRFQENNLATEGRLLNIGRGGMFVALDGAFPAVRAKTYFSIRIGQGELQSISGEGVVRWIRTQHSECFPKGCGIEFEFLDDPCRKAVIEIIDRLKMKAYIPKN